MDGIVKHHNTTAMTGAKATDVLASEEHSATEVTYHAVKLTKYV